jgi:hypothetical protein
MEGTEKRIEHNTRSPLASEITLSPPAYLYRPEAIGGLTRQRRASVKFFLVSSVLSLTLFSSVLKSRATGAQKTTNMPIKNAGTFVPAFCLLKI